MTTQPGKMYTVLEAYDLSADDVIATSEIKAENIEKVGVSCVFDSITTGTTAAADIYLEASIDGVSWFRTDATNHTVSSADLSTGQNLGFGADGLYYPYLRAKCEGTGITGGTLDVKIWGKFTQQS